MTYHTVSLQTFTLPDGRIFLPDIEVMHHRAMGFVERYQNYWQRDEQLSGWVSPTIEGETVSGRIEAK